MGRRQRVDAPGSWHHVMNRGSGRRLIFRDDVERRWFLDLVAELGPRFDVHVHAYCLMGNHFHLLLQSAESRLSEAMQWLTANYTRLVNCRRCVDGPVFRGRFHSVPADRPEHRQWLFRYINANPLDLGWTQPLADYRWSGIGESPDWLRSDEASRLFGDRARLIEFVERARTGPGRIGRSGDVAALARADVEAAAVVASLPGPHVHGRSDKRAVVAVVWADDLGGPIEELDGLDVTDPRAARQNLTRARRRVETRPEMAAFAERVRDVLRSSNPAAVGSQSVSDTDCDGDVDGRVA